MSIISYLTLIPTIVITSDKKNAKKKKNTENRISIKQIHVANLKEGITMAGAKANNNLMRP